MPLADPPRRLWLSLHPFGPGSAPPGAVEVAVERFIIGRARHCGLVVISNVVSREHAAVLRVGPDFFIEDLGSTAGTWHRQERLQQRRRIEDGDVYVLNAQVPVYCLLR